MKVGLISIGFPNFRYDYAQKYLEISLNKLGHLISDLETCGKTLIDESHINDEIIRLKACQIDMIIVQIGTYSYGSSMMKIIETFNETPLLLWGFREPIIEGFRGLPLNSLCGLNMFASFLEKVDKKFAYVYGDVEDYDVYQRIEKTLKAIHVKTQLKSSKFCVIGGRVPGFYLSNVDELRFRHEVGAEIVYYSVASLLEDVKNIDSNRVKDEVKKIQDEVFEVTTSHEMLEKTARIYLAIMDYQSANQIDAFTIKCWPEFQALDNCSVCGVVSRLNNEGIMTSCEGDITGLTTLYLQYLLTQKPCFFADLVNLNESGVFKTWHCGPAPLSLTRDYTTTKYTEHPTIKQGMGIAVEFKMKLGRLIMLKLKESKNTYKLFMASGEGIEEDRDMVANQADIIFDSKPSHIIETIMKHGIEHHYAIVYEDIKDELLEVCKWMNFEVVDCD